MAADVPMVDDVVKEYLVFRGFSSTLKSFESDLKADKDKSFRVRCVLNGVEFRDVSFKFLMFAQK